MSVEDDAWEGVVSSIVSDNYSQSDDALSPEDAAWVDSCLVKDAELSENSWDAMKDALIDILYSKSPSDNITSVAENDGYQTGSSVDVLMTEEGTNQGPDGTKQAKDVQSLGQIDDDLPPITDMEEVGLVRGFLLNKSKLRDQKRNKKAEVGPDLSMTNETESPLDDIFKVWDLNTPLDEEDELVKQLEKALAEGPVTTDPLVLDNSVSNDLDMGALDSLISGLADLSLHPLSGS